MGEVVVEGKSKAFVAAAYRLPGPMPDAQERIQLNTVTTKVQDSREHINEKVPGAMSVN